MCPTVSEEKGEKNPKRSAAAMEMWRKRKRAGFKPGFSGLIAEGIASDGSMAMTRETSRLGIYEPYRGITRIHFRVAEKGPRKSVTTDVYHAVRMTKHIEESYIGELEKNDAILRSISIENLKLATGQKGREDIEKAIENIKAVLKSLTKIRTPKKTFSREQLKRAISYLEDAIKDRDRINGQKISIACTKLVSFRTRYGNWRDREIEAMKEYSRLRGYALRKMRDEWLLSNISNWVRYLGRERKGFQMKSLWLRDMNFSNKLEKLLENKKKMKLEALEKISEELYNAGRKDGAGYNIRKMHRAQEALIAGDEKKARRLVREYMLLLRVRNPFYVAREMGNETDTYYHIASKKLKGAARTIENEAFNVAVERLDQAAEEIRRRVPTPQTSFGFPSQSQR
jgi:hypothetical protein